MPKFFVREEQIKNDEILINGRDFNHIVNVLRMKTGDRVNVCDIDSKINYIANITEITDIVRCKIEERLNSNIEPETHITLFQGLPKADKMELIIEKGTEVGVSEFIPVEMLRCVVKLDDKNKQKKLDRWQKIAETAAKQSGRDYIPKLESVISIKNICNLVKNYDIVLLAYEDEKENNLKGKLISLVKGTRVAIIIGPEGGMDKTEVKSLIEAGVETVSLGKRILRTETAGLVMAANILYGLEG